MKKKAISLLLVAAMTATMTAGCGDKQEAADNTTAGNDAAPSTAVSYTHLTLPTIYSV